MYYNITKRYTVESIHKSSKPKAFGLKVIICCLLVFSCVVCLASCSATYKRLSSDLFDFLEANSNYEYIVKYRFKTSSDIAKIEARLEAFRFKIEEKKQTDKEYEYKLTNHYLLTDDYLEFATQNYDVSFVINGTDKNLISRNDIIGITNLGEQLYVCASERFVKSFYNRYSLEDVLCRCDGVAIDTMVVDHESNGKYYLSLALDYDYANREAPENQEAIDLAIKAVIAYSSEPLESDVEAEIVKSATFYQPSQNS